jgi:hypothetical protein
MAIKLPIEGRYSQPNNSDKFGSIWASKNINLDEEGYLKLSPRTIMIANRTDDVSFGHPNAIGRWMEGNYLVATADKNYNIVISPVDNPAPDVNTGNGNPTTALGGGGVFWQNLWFATDADKVFSRVVNTDSAAIWTLRISGLTSTVQHRLAVFVSRQTLCVSDGNVVRQYNTSYVQTINLVIPSDFEVVGLAYNNNRMGIITRLGSSTAGQNTEAMFFIWDGATSGANNSAGVGSSECLSICAYKSSFAILTRAGQLLYWNGGGFDVLANFPFYYEDKFLGGGFLNVSTRGLNMIADGDVLYVNIPNALTPFNRKKEFTIPNMPGGVWCFDPKVGLYHRWSPSISKLHYHSIAAANINTATDVITTSGIIPATGNIARVTHFSSGARVVGGLKDNYDYYIIKLTSTTFKLANTRENALAGIAIDITAADTTTTIFMYDIVDYASSYIGPGAATAIALVGEKDEVKTDILIGGGFFPLTMGGAVQSLAIAVPFLENRGWFITPKIFSSEVIDSAQKLFVKFRPLKTGDKIIFKYRNKEIEGLPVSSSILDVATWTGLRDFYTTQDLSEAKTYLDAGGKLECELTAGAGGGQMVQIVSISTDDNLTYSVEVAEDILGVVAGNKSSYIINNWEVKKVITSTDKCPVSIPLGGSASWMQFKIELRGVDVAIEELQIVSTVAQQSV